MIPSIEYTIKKHKSAKSLKIKIDSNGIVVVVSPPYIPRFVLNQFVNKNKDWILKHTEKQKNKPKLNSKDSVHIFGKKYDKKLDFSLTKKIGIYIHSNNLVFNPTSQPQLDSQENKEKWNNKFQEKLDTFLKSTASHYIIARTHKIAEKMNLTFNKITLKKQKTRWGSCSSQKNLNFNWQLVHFEPKIIDYVIIHELSHLVNMNHSKKFWDLVAQYDPEYKKHVGWLKRNGLHLG
jgi:predicted metal-dependent hydrolase